MAEFRFTVSDDAERALAETGAFLRSDPAAHNLVLTLLEERARHPEPGRFGWIDDGSTVVGVVFQSPLDLHAALTPMPAPAVEAVASALSEIVPDLPGVFAAAETAARFAGCWAETRGVAATPVEGQRLYELVSLQEPRDVPGQALASSAADTELVLRWLMAFKSQTGGPAAAPDTVARRVGSGLIWLWDDEGPEPVAMAGVTPASAGVARVGPVYTPPEHRGHGYAAAVTCAATRAALSAGADRCVLFTQLHNPRANAIYRRLGYEPISENVRYRFAPASSRSDTRHPASSRTRKSANRGAPPPE